MAISVSAVSVTTPDGSSKSLGDYAGKVLLIVNVASRCGFTKQYAGLQALNEAYAAKVQARKMASGRAKASARRWTKPGEANGSPDFSAGLPSLPPLLPPSISPAPRHPISVYIHTLHIRQRG